MGWINIYSDDLYRYETKNIFNVSDRNITVEDHLCLLDSFRISVKTVRGILNKCITCLNIRAWEYVHDDYSSEDYDRVSDPVFEKLRLTMQAIAVNNENLRAIKDLE